LLHEEEEDDIELDKKGTVQVVDNTKGDKNTVFRVNVGETDEQGRHKSLREKLPEKQGGEQLQV